MLTKEQQKQNAIHNLKKIGCYKPYIKAYIDGTITMYEGFGGYYIDNKELMNQIQEIEDRYDGTVYAVIHSFTGFGELYTMLWTTGYEGDAEYDVEDCGHNQFACMSYVWNKTYDDCSEFGTVIIKPALGGLLRLN